MENRMALDLFIGICGALCLIVGASILLGKLVRWIQEKLRLRKEEKELGRIVQQQKRWENLEKELAKLDNSSAIDMVLDPKPWGHLPVDEQKYVMNCLNCGEIRHFAPYNGPGAADRACTECGLGLWTKEAQERGMKHMDIMPSSTDEFQKQGRLDRAEQIHEAPHTLWCPRCNSGKRHLAHAVGGVPHFKCEDCGQRYKQIVIANPTKPGLVRWDRNAVEAVPAAPSSSDLIIIDEIAPYPPGIVDWPAEAPTSLADPSIKPDVTFGGGDFGGSGAGDSYDSSTDSGSSSTDTSSSSDYSSSNDD